MDDVDDLPGEPLGAAGGPDGRFSGGKVSVPTSLAAYLSTRTDDFGGAIRSLVAGLARAGVWTPVAGSLANAAGLSPCRFDAALLLRRERCGISAVIAAGSWSVTLIGDEAWIDVEWPSHAWAAAMHGQPVSSQIDFPFVTEALVVRASEPFGTHMRFHCGICADIS
jgi:hypothetical protein